MDATADELAGVVDLFGGLTRTELERALSEAAYRADGQSVDEDALDDAIEDALASFALVRYERDGDGDGIGEPLLVAGPTAFPSVPDHAEDVPHILDVERRRLDRETLGAAAAARFAEGVDETLDDDGDVDRDPDSGPDLDPDRIDHLLDVSYDVEAWAPVDLTAERERLEAALE